MKSGKGRGNSTPWMENLEMSKTKVMHIAGWMAVMVVFFGVAGCVTPGPVQETPQAPAPETASAPASQTGKETPPGQLPEGLDGFIITETAEMSEIDRKAFDEAVTLLNTEAYGRAIEILEKIVAHTPRVAAPYINLGIAFARTDKPDEAEAQFKKALALVPGHPVAGNECALLFRKKGRFDEARALYEQVLAGYPNYYPVHRNLGILCDLYLGDLQSALNHYQIYSQAMPKDDKVKLWIADLKARVGAE